MHEIQALIGSDAATATIAGAWSAAVRRELVPGLFILPITRALGRQMTGSDLRWPDLENADEMSDLSRRLEWLAGLVRGVRPAGGVALVLTQYFGGVGEQAALLFDDDGKLTESRVGSEAINAVLAALGVRRDHEEGRDEFDVVGLGGWRTSEEIAEDAG